MPSSYEEDRPPGLRACMATARMLRRSERGRALVDLLRPRAVSWLLRDRPPLTLQLLLAGREHRLVRRGPSGLAVVEFPVGIHDQAARGQRSVRWLRRLDLLWPAVGLGGPAAVLLTAGLAVAVLGDRRPAVLLVAVLLVLLAVLWVTAVLSAGVVGTLVRAWWAVERTPDSRAFAAGPLLGAHWSISVCHATGPAAVPELIGAARHRVEELTQRLPDSLSPAQPGSHILLCQLDGVTSARSERALRELPDSVPLPGTRPRLLCLGDSRAMLPAGRARYPARGIFLIIGGSLAAVALLALLTAERERGTCGGIGCRGLTSYTDALQYLFGRLIPFAGDGGLAPAGAGVRVLGWTTSLLGLTLIGCVVVALGRHITFAQSGVDRTYDVIRAALEARRPTFAVVTALPEEFAAVRAALDNPVDYPVARDRSRYLLGTMPSSSGAPHTVVATLAPDAGNDLAAAASTNVARSFHTVNCVVMVGIAAGVPRPGTPDRHVRLGDVVVATWGVVDFDHVDQRPEGVYLRAGMPQPSTLLKGSAQILRAEEESGARPWETEIARIVHALPQYARPAENSDVLHGTGSPVEVITHPNRTLSGRRDGQPQIHHGLIGSSDRSLRDGRVRDSLAQLYQLSALEMEGKGIANASALNGVEWFVVRGISDYGDVFTDETWRRYAAAAAAAYTRALLGCTPSLDPRGGHVRGSD